MYLSTLNYALLSTRWATPALTLSSGKQPRSASKTAKALLPLESTQGPFKQTLTGLTRCACAAVLPFAKRGDDRSNNLVRLQQLFPRIVAADYEQPKRVSEDCRHLLKRMLTPDPNKRVTIPEIMQHPW